MKKIIFFSVFLILSFQSFSQQTNTKKALTKDHYILKSKHQKTAATIVLLSGPVLIGGTLLISSKIKNGGNASMGIVYGTIMAGFLCLPVSLGLYIASSSNHKKAMRLSFKNESIPQISKQNFVYKAVPSLSLKISL